MLFKQVFVAFLFSRGNEKSKGYTLTSYLGPFVNVFRIDRRAMYAIRIRMIYLRMPNRNHRGRYRETT